VNTRPACGQVLEQLELLVGELEQPPAQPGGVGGLVDHQLAEHQRAAVATGVGARAGLQQPQPGIHLGRAGAGQQDLVDHPLAGHRDQAALGEHRDHRHVHAGAAEQPAQAARGDQVGARVDQDGVVRAGVEQCGDLGRGRANTVREQRQGWQHGSRIGVGGQQKEFHGCLLSAEVRTPPARRASTWHGGRR